MTLFADLGSGCRSADISTSGSSFSATSETSLASSHSSSIEHDTLTGNPESFLLRHVNWDEVKQELSDITGGKESFKIQWRSKGSRSLFTAFESKKGTRIGVKIPFPELRQQYLGRNGWRTYHDEKPSGKSRDSPLRTVWRNPDPRPYEIEYCSGRFVQ